MMKKLKNEINQPTKIFVYNTLFLLIWVAQSKQNNIFFKLLSSLLSNHNFLMKIYIM